MKGGRYAKALTEPTGMRSPSWEIGLPPQRVVFGVMDERSPLILPLRRSTWRSAYLGLALTFRSFDS
ncbi:MAG: hypothetical protein EA397_02305 [Deltaproteobacteria bacterium]|nr:MAG: hypothetical protein EA397_02305 [Deltaproteobacteria bacterium]